MPMSVGLFLFMRITVKLKMVATFTFLNQLEQEAFRERRHLHVCDLWPWVVTLTLSQGQIGLCH